MIEGPVQYGRLDVGGAREYPEVGSIPAYKRHISWNPTTGSASGGNVRQRQ